jgi:CSLREA domain-containing protein
MSRKSSRRTARRSGTRSHSLRAQSSLGRSLYRRRLWLEPLENRRLLAVVTVTTLSDTVDFNDGQTSLREAIFAANIVPGADTIEFAPNLTAAGPAKILLAHGELAITDALTIDGPGSGLLTIDGQGNSRLFDLAPAGSYAAGPPPIGVCTIAGLTLTGGRASGPSDPFGGNTPGGAIRSATSSPLTIDDCIISANRADKGVGEAIFSRGDLTLVDCTISGNTSSSQSGVAAYSFGRITATDTAIRNNQGDGIDAFGDVALVRCIVEANGANASLGPGVFSLGNVTVDDSAIRNNTAGGIVAKGTLSLRQSIVSGNTGGLIGSFESTSPAGTPQLSRGAGIYAHGGVELVDSTVSGNRGAALGGGVFSDGSVSLSGSTISGNSASMYGGGLFAAGDVAISYCTIANNSADGTGGGIFANRNVRQIVIAGSIVAGNTAPLFDLKSDIYSRSAPIEATSSLIGDNYQTSLVESPVGVPDANGNLIGGPIHGVIDPKLGPLADNGGFALPDGRHILTHALLPGSPAINAGDLAAVAGQDGVPTYDERGTPFSRVFGGRIDIGAFEYQASSDLNLLVDTLADESDGNFARGDLSLREAIELANMYPGFDTIRFDPTLTAAGPATILLTHGELAIADYLRIAGPGANLLTIDASGNDPTPGVADGKGSRVFNIGVATDLSGVTLTGGDVDGDGGGILTVDSIVLSYSTIRDNFATGDGGGVKSSSYPLAISNCTITQNRAHGSGGGISSSEGGFLLFQAQVLGNEASGAGGGISSVSESTYLEYSTISGNVSSRKGGGISSTGGSLYGYKSDVSNNTSDDQGGGIYRSGDMTLYGCTVSGNNAFRGGSYGLGNGGGISSRDGKLTMSECTVSANVAAAIGGGIWHSGDLGISRSHLDGNSAQFGGGAVSQGGGLFSLSESYVDGNVGGGLSLSGDSAVVVDRSVIKANTSGAGIYELYGGPLTISNSIVSGNIAGTNARGGGITAFSSSLTLRDSLIANNTAGTGAGLFISNSCPEAIVTGTTFSGNRATNLGGGIYDAGSKLTLVNTTISGNVAGVTGGGICVHGRSPSELDITNGTIVGNLAGTGNYGGSGGGLFDYHGTVNLDSTIIAGNRVAPFGIGPDLTGLLGVSIVPRYSLIGTNLDTGLASTLDGKPDANGNLIGGSGNSAISPRLGSLRDNGGTLLPDDTHIPTMSPLLGSPAINAGDPSAVAGAGGVPVSDERGVPFTRVFGGRIDIGAVESEPSGFLAGDFNRNGIVDAADYTLWQDSRGNSVVANGSGADGNSDGVVNDLDYGVWRTNFGATLPAMSGAASVDAIQAKVTQPPISLRVSGATALRVGALSNSSPADPEAGHPAGAARVLVMRRRFDVAARQDLLFASWIANRNANVSGRDSSGFDRLSSDAAPGETGGSEIAAVDGAFETKGSELLSRKLL